jgi:transposase
MASMTVPALHPQPGQLTAVVVGGIDTHRDLHMVAVVDGDGMVLGTESFSTTRAGYRALLRWMRSFGDLRRVGIEGTGSYGAGVTRHLADADVEVLEIDRPDRTDRRRRGKSDTFDAICAAQAALAGRRTSIPKSRDGRVESLRVLKLTRATAIRARTKALQLLRHHIVSAPEELRDQVRNLTRMQLCSARLACRSPPRFNRCRWVDPYPNALMESVIGLFKTEAIATTVFPRRPRQGPRRHRVRHVQPPAPARLAWDANPSRVRTAPLRCPQS